jgi:hypothetical protein
MSRALAIRILVFLGIGLLAAGCAGSTSTPPNVATSETAVPGAVPQLGKADAGTISISDVSIVRTGKTLRLRGRITNSGTAPDALLQVSSQVSKPVTLAPPLALPPGKTVQLDTAKTPVLLTEDGRLQPGGTVDLALQLQRTGLVQLFSKFTDG